MNPSRLPKKENVLNAYLAEILTQLGVSASAEEKKPDGRQIDVECKIGEITVAIEAKHGYSRAQRKGAIRDANDRLLQSHCDVAIAVVYPDEHQTFEDLRSGELSANIRTSAFEPVSTALNAEARQATWRTLQTSGFAHFVNQAPNERGSPEALAKKADIAIRTAAGLFGALETESILKKMAMWDGPNKTNLAGVMTDLLAAVMFHTKLDQIRDSSMPAIDARTNPPSLMRESDLERWPPKSVAECLHSDQVANDLRDAHSLWMAVDYGEILEWSCSILNAMPDSPKTNTALRLIANAAVEIQRTSGGQHHDLIGITFCQSLENAKFDGSFYTTIPAAVLLAHLLFQDADVDWTDFDQVSTLKIVDYACGTGTLLIAAANYVLEHEKTGRREDVAVALLEQMLHGFDVNNRTRFQTATGLGMIAPRVAFKSMHLYSLLLGFDEDDHPRVGSLEMLDGKDQLHFNPKPATATRIESEPAPVEETVYDFAIMNPPYTRDSKRYDQFEPDEENRLKEREKGLLARTSVHRSGGANGFHILADKHLDERAGRLAFVAPSSTANNPSVMAFRKTLAKRFHVKTLVLPYDPKRFHYSGNTKIGEMLVIVERKPDGPCPPTKVIKLVSNPATASDAVACAASIASGDVEQQWGFAEEISRDEIEKGKWSALLFAHPGLNRAVSALKWESNLGTQVKLIRTDLQGKTDKFEAKVPGATPTLYDQNSDHCVSLKVEPDYWVSAKPDDPDSRSMLAKTSSLKVPFRLSIPTAKVTSVITSLPTSQAAWYGAIPLKLGDHTTESVEKAVCMILNSTLGKVALLSIRNTFKPIHFKLSLTGLKGMPFPNIPDIPSENMGTLVAAFDELSGKPKKDFANAHECDVQKAIDAAVCVALGDDIHAYQDARHLLAAEPMVSQRSHPAITSGP